MSENPRLDEIQARLDAHVKCADCGKCRDAAWEEWCPKCDYWSCERGLACGDEPYAADVRYLLTELRKAREALAAVEVLAESWRYKGEFGWGAWQEGHGPDMEGTILDNASSALRAAVAAAKGDE